MSGNLASIDLPDINVWLALSAPDHPHRDLAERYWREQASSRIAFNTVTMLGLVRISSNAAVLGGQPLTPADAWNVYLGWREMAEVTYVPEPKTCGVVLNRWVSSDAVTPRTWTDAYLAAFAVAGGCRLVTLDRDFRRFQGLDVLLLEK